MERSSVIFPRRKLRRIDFKAINLRYCLQDLILNLIQIKFERGKISNRNKFEHGMNDFVEISKNVARFN